eukprot:scaffold299557_cov32-Tisochrysis_lutea.AAC.1
MWASALSTKLVAGGRCCTQTPVKARVKMSPLEEPGGVRGIKAQSAQASSAPATGNYNYQLPINNSNTNTPTLRL